MDLLRKTGLSAHQQTSRVCVIGAGPCGLSTIKNLRAHGLRNIVCYDEGEAIGGNWAFKEQPERASVYESTHLISSKKLSEFEDYAMPDDYPEFPSHQQMLTYFQSYAAHFQLLPYIRLRTRVEQARRTAEDRWSIRVLGPNGASEENFDWLLVCSGHHREPLIPDYANTFAGEVLHSCQFKRPEPFRNKKVLVVGGGNSGCDIAVDVSRVARKCCLSMRRGYHILPKVVFGRPADVLAYRIRRYLSLRTSRRLIRILLPFIVGPWEKYGLQVPKCLPLQMHPTLNTNILSALRDGVVVPRVGIARFEGENVYFHDGTVEEFDTIIWATGFLLGFPFLDSTVVDWGPSDVPPLYLKMMHRRITNLSFIGLFQPLGCIWRLADRQAHIAALQIVGSLNRPADIESRIDKENRLLKKTFEKTTRHAVEVDYWNFQRQLDRELAQARRFPTAVKVA
jgi:hypothetical protein